MRRAAVAAAALALAAAAVGCSDDGDPRAEARAGGSIVVAEAAPPGSLDPALVDSPAGLRAAWLAYTPPLTYRRAEGAAGTELVAALAEEPPTSEDGGRSYALTLRDGLSYPNGTPLRASDVERAIARALRLSPRGSELFGGIVGARAYALSERPGVDIEGIAVDDAAGTVEIDLETPDRMFPYALADVAAAPVPPGTPLADRTRRPPPGIGPYRVSQVRENGDVVLTRRPDWRLAAVPAGHAREIVTRTIPERERRVRAVRDGRADIVEGEAPLRILPDVRSGGDGRYAEYPLPATLQVSIDASREPFRAADVRRALAFALDTRVLAQLHDGFMQPTCNMLPPAVAGYRRLDPCPFGDRSGDADLVRASELVEAAGVDGARVTVGGGPTARARRLARYLAETLRKIGLDARLGARERAQVAFEAVAPALPHPAGFLRDDDDPVLSARVALLTQEAAPADAAEQWAEVDADLVENAYAAPYGVPTAGVLASERVDLEGCGRFHPVFGMDYSSVCLR
ncbi:MAG: hypothetical protein GXY03_08475 [Solirubrobacterales bacterium]|nr:hypothetical protein [Solirubrobacterales bacterium]